MPKRGENIRKRKDGRYEARFIDFYKPDGKAHYKSVYAKTYGELKQKIKLHDKTKPKKILSANKNIAEISHEWLEKVKLRVKESSFCRYCSIVQSHILPYFQNYDISMITRETAEKFMDLKLQDLSVKTVHDIVCVFLQIIKFAERKGCIADFNYDLDLPKLQAKELDILSYAEEQRLDSYIKNNLRTYLV